MCVGFGYVRPRSSRGVKLSVSTKKLALCTMIETRDFQQSGRFREIDHKDDS